MKASAGDCDTCHRPAVTLYDDHGHDVRDPRDTKGAPFRVAQVCRRCLDEARKRRARATPSRGAAPPSPSVDPRQLDMFAPSLGLGLALEPARGRR